jgi:hypothetical protein
MDDLFKALKMFSDGTKELAFTNALDQANQQVQDIKTSIDDKQQQRLALQDVSNRLVTQMAQYGVPATTMAQVAGAVGPKHYNTPAEAAIEGTLGGDKTLVDAAANADKAAQAGNIEQLKISQDFLGKEHAKDRALKWAMLNDKKNKTIPLTQGQLDKLNAQEDAIAIGTDIMAKVKQNPDLVGFLAGRVPLRDQEDPEFAAFKASLDRFSDKYRLAVTGQGAGPKELQMLLSRTPQSTDVTQTFLAKMDGYVKETNGSRQRAMKNYKNAKRDIGNFAEDLLSSDSEAADSPSLQGTPVTVKDKKTGEVIPALRMPDGRIVRRAN